VVALAREAAEGRLRALVPSLGARLVFIEVVVGEPAERISEIAAEFHAELIVAGPHGPRPLPWNLLGGTAERLVRTAGKPVLVVRAPRPRPPRKVLVPLEDVEIPAPVATWVSRLHSECGAVATALTVLPFADGESQLAPGWPEPPAPVAIRRQHDRWLDGLRRQLGLDSKSFSSSVAFGDPAREIVAAARKSGSDLVLMASHGPGTLGRAVLGSVAGSVMRGAPCPVLVVHHHPRKGRPKRTGRSR
jgi:nucleotide-binding universal stress UspA family protein